MDVKVYVNCRCHDEYAIEELNDMWKYLYYFNLNETKYVELPLKFGDYEYQILFEGDIKPEEANKIDLLIRSVHNTIEFHSHIKKMYYFHLEVFANTIWYGGNDHERLC